MLEHIIYNICSIKESKKIKWEWKIPLGSRTNAYKARKGKIKIDCRYMIHLSLSSIPQCSQEDHNNGDELKNFNFIEQSRAPSILQVLQSPLQVASNFRQLLHSTNALHKNAILFRCGEEVSAKYRL